MTLFSSLAFLLFLSSTATLVSSNPIVSTIAEFISGPLEDSRLAYLKNLAGLADPVFLDNLGNATKDFTVFAPLNPLFDAVASMNGYQANRTAFYHVIEGQEILRSKFVTQSYCPMLYGVALDFVVVSIFSPPKISISFGGGRTAKLSNDWLQASNGRIYFVDKVLEPIESPCWTTGEFLSQCCNRTATPVQIMQPPTTPPTSKPTSQPTNKPTSQPTSTFPTKSPTSSIGLSALVSTDTDPPTDQPTKEPTDQPTREPTDQPTTKEPTDQPTEEPTKPPKEKKIKRRKL